jgi:hypothetical protein
MGQILEPSRLHFYSKNTVFKYSLTFKDKKKSKKIKHNNKRSLLYSYRLTEIRSNRLLF